MNGTILGLWGMNKGTVMGLYPLVMTSRLQTLKMAMEIVSFPMKHGDFPQVCERLSADSFYGGLTYRKVERTLLEVTVVPSIINVETQYYDGMIIPTMCF